MAQLTYILTQKAVARDLAGDVTKMKQEVTTDNIISVINSIIANHPDAENFNVVDGDIRAHILIRENSFIFQSSELTNVLHFVKEEWIKDKALDIANGGFGYSSELTVSKNGYVLSVSCFGGQPIIGGYHENVVFSSTKKEMAEIERAHQAHKNLMEDDYVEN
jgi:hypothetical protein